MILLIGVILTSLFFLVVLFLCSKTWKIAHIFAMFLVFGASIAFMIFATISLKTHDAWETKVKSMRATLEEQQKIKRELEVGNLDMLDTENSQLVLPKELWRQTYDQGQVLRGCTPGPFEGNVSVTTPASNGLDKAMVVHAFKEVDGADGKIPKLYIGEFAVTAATDTSATLTPTLPLDEFQQNLATNRDGSTWALYGRLPHDNHFAFVDPEATNPVEVAKEAVRVAEQELSEAKRAAALGEENAGVGAAEKKLESARKALERTRAEALPLFGQPLSKEQLAGIMPNTGLLKQLLPPVLYQPEMNDAQYNDHITKLHQAYLRRYLFDGVPVADVAPDFDIDKNTFQKVKFVFDDDTKVHEIQVDATGAPQEADEDPENREALYDSLGFARPERLRQGSPTRFTNVYDIDKRFKDPNLGPTALADVGVFDQDTADSLVAAGTAEKLDDQFYVRPLRDYEYLFHEYQLRDGLLNEQRSAITAGTRQVTNSIALAQAQLNILSQQKAKLDADEVAFKKDLDTITAERVNLEAAKQAQLNELRSLYQRINEEVATLMRLQRELAEEVQKRAAMAAADGGN